MSTSVNTDFIIDLQRASHSFLMWLFGYLDILIYWSWCWCWKWSSRLWCDRILFWTKLSVDDRQFVGIGADSLEKNSKRSKSPAWILTTLVWNGDVRKGFGCLWRVLTPPLLYLRSYWALILGSSINFQYMGCIRPPGRMIISLSLDKSMSYMPVTVIGEIANNFIPEDNSLGLILEDYQLLDPRTPERYRMILIEAFHTTASWRV